LVAVCHPSATRPTFVPIPFHQYLRSDTARWEDWKASVRAVLQPDANADGLQENLSRD